MKKFWKREPTNERADKPSAGQTLKMVTLRGESFFSWDGKLYESDIVRACIRPKVKAIGKLIGKHIRDDPKTGGIKVNPDANIRFILSEPNPYMTGQQLQEKVANQLCLNNNAFILVVRDENGKPLQLYPVPCVSVEAKYNDDGELFLKFLYTSGKTGIFRYSDVIHLKQDYNENDIFGTSPAPVLSGLMTLIGTIDQGIVKAIKNSSVIRWLISFKQSMRDEDIKRYVQNFVDNYLSVESTTFGAAGVDAKADVQRIEPKDYVPNALQSEKIIDRIYSFFGTNRKIVQSDYTEDEWTAYYEAEIEPVVVQLYQTYTVALFSRRERGCGNRIVFEANNLQCASLTTKLAFQAMVDRGAMTPNEWRETMSLAPIEGGDQPIRRLDTQVVDLLENMLGKVNSENCMQMTAVMLELLRTGGKGEDEVQS
jgi:HK97 family phage portal protein